MSAPKEAKYRKRAASEAMSGYEYEKKMLALVTLRASGLGRPFRLATGMHHAGRFDDVVLSVGGGTDARPRVLCVQLKHKRGFTVRTDTLAGTNKDFSLLRYFDDYCEMKRLYPQEEDLKSLGPFDEFAVIIYTNAKSVISEEMLEISSDHGLLLPTGGTVFKVRDDSSLRRHLENHCGDDKLKLDSLGEFLRKFELHVGQPDHSKLDQLITEDIAKRCKVSQCGAQEILKKFMASVAQWWGSCENKAYFITNNNLDKLFHEINFRLIPDIPILPSHMMQFENFGLEFLSDELDKLCAEFSFSSESTMTMILAQETSTSLACLKVKQAVSTIFKHSIILDLDTAWRYKDEVLNVWPSEWCPLLVIECPETCTQPNNKDKIHSFIPDRCQKDIWHLMLITKERHLLKNISCCDKFTTSAKHVTCEFPEFTAKSKEIIMERKIMFQGQDVCIGSILHLDETTERTVGSVLLARLVDEREPIEIGKPISGLLPYYVSRQVQLYDSVSLDILWTDQPVLFAISGVDQKDIEKLLKEQEFSRNGCSVPESPMKILNATENIYLTDGNNPSCELQYFQSTSTRFIKENVNIGNTVNVFNKKYKICNYITIQSEKDFEDLCGLHQNVHWLHMAENKLFWRQSHGDTAVVHENFERNNTTIQDENDFWRISSKNVVITAEPGMGKTSLLNHLIYQQKKVDTCAWVVCVSNDNTMEEWLAKDDKIPGKSSADSVLVINAIKNGDEAEKAIFKHALDVSPENIIVIVDCVEEFFPESENAFKNFIVELQKLNLKKIVLSSRQMEGVDLRELLQVTEICLMPLNQQKCQMLLSKYWKFLQGEDLDEQSQKNIVEGFIKTTGGGFVANPSHLVMLLEVYKNNHSNQLLNNGIDLFQLLDTWISMKTDTSLSCKMGENKNLGKQVVHAYQGRINNIHMITSIRSLLSDNDFRCFVEEKTRNEVTEFIELLTTEYSDYFKAEILTGALNGKPKFLHKLYADYLFPRWLLVNLSENINLLEKIIFFQKYSTVKDVWNQLVCQNKPLHKAVLCKDVQQLSELLATGIVNVNARDDVCRTTLHIAAGLSAKDQASIVQDLLHHKADASAVYQFNMTPAAINSNPSSSDWVFLGSILQHQTGSSDIDTVVKILAGKPVSAMSGIYTACRCGYVNLLNILSRVVDTTDQAIQLTLCEILHFACRAGQYEIVKCLIDQFGMPPEIRHKLFRSPLHAACMGGSLQIVKYLVNDKNIDPNEEIGGLAPVQCAVSDAKLEIMKYLINDHAADVNVQDVWGKTLLHLDVENDSVETIEIGGMAPVQCAVSDAKLEIMKYLINDHDVDVSIQDVWGKTLLHLAVEYDSVETIEYLVKCCKMDVNIADNSGNTPIRYAQILGRRRAYSFLRHECETT
ncbi:uncharacterized protein LOC134538840 [Bacillus rossius redtenbacheri]|uniref:uncharacterized protein LOC134538840 n=1 Tax=Bacillus rossius redtenbacheri TaxID=93214 RepID=UPI002FDDFCCA